MPTSVYSGQKLMNEVAGNILPGTSNIIPVILVIAPEK